MSSVATLERPRMLSLRPLALPAEHGGWGFLLEPILLGLLVAPSFGGLCIGAGAVAAFLARHPLKLAAQDLVRGKRYARTRACGWLAFAYASIAAGFFVLAPARAIIALGAAIPFALIQFAFDARNRSRALMPELIGVLAPGAIAASIAIAAGRTPAFAATLWLIVILRSIPSILYVRAALRGESRGLALGAHIAAAVAAFFVTPLAVIPMLVLLARAIAPTEGLAAKTIGLRELAWGGVTVVLLALAM